MDKKAYMKEYRALNRERLIAKDREYYHAVRKFQERGSRRKDPQSRCTLCTIFLDSKYAGKGRRKYCNSCIRYETPNLLKLYSRRGHQKREGLTPEAINLVNVRRLSSAPITN